MTFVPKKCDFLDLFEILGQGLETHLSYHFCTKTAAKCLTVKMKVLQKFLYQLS